MAGDSETGVSLQKMVYELDAGDVLGERKLAITPETDARDLFARLSRLAQELLHVELMDYVRGNLVGRPQDASQMTLAPKILKSESEIRWGDPTVKIFCLVRGLAAGPVAYTLWNQTRLKILKCKMTQLQSTTLAIGDFCTQSERLFAVCGDRQLLELLEVQPESKRAMTARDFIAGFKNQLKELA